MTPSEQRQAYKKAWNQKNKTQIKRVNLTLTHSEFTAFEKHAKKEGVTVTTLIKNMAVAYEQQLFMLTDERKAEFQETRFLLRNIANNMNQLAHHSHIAQKVIDENAFLREMKKLEDMIIHYYQKLKP
jgi:deoxyribodipyrimidine photolyase-like uncharacterized protein